jgi:hypothetical protein
LDSAALTVGKSTAVAATDRVIPLNSRTLAALNALAVQFPDRCDKHYVFPSERDGAQRPQSECQNDMVTSGRRLTC